MTLLPWKTLNSRIVFQHRWYTLKQEEVQLPNGTCIDDYFISVRPDVVEVFALTPEHQVILVRQYKHAAGDIIRELPAGVINTGETPLQAGSRELREETGYASDDYVLLGSYYSNPTRNSNQIHIVLALNSYWVGEQQLDENEQASGIEVELRSIPDLLHGIRIGDIKAQTSVMAIYRSLDYLNLLTLQATREKSGDIHDSQPNSQT